MKKFLAMFVVLSLCFGHGCRAVKHAARLPRLSVVSPIFLGVEESPIAEDEKAEFINSLMAQVWSDDFGKFTELFYRDFFNLPAARRHKLETLTVTQDTFLAAELLMKYLYETSTRGCLNLFRSWIDFYKSFRCNARKKEMIFESFKEFVCKFLIEISKNFYITTELLRERTAIMCELYDLEDRKMLLS